MQNHHHDNNKKILSKSTDQGFAKAKNQKGSAMLVAIFTISFVIFLALEISNQTLAEYFASAGEVKKVQSYYAAKSCLQLSLLRIKAYQQASAALSGLGAQGAGPDTSQIDMIWKMPLSWPPALPDDLSSFDTSTFKASVGTSLMTHQFASSISSAGGKLDINDLGSPARVLRERTKKQLLERLQARVQNSDDAFAERYSNFNFEEVINNIADWIDTDDVSLNGGGEKSLYSDYRSDFYPPNRPLKTHQELHMVSGMTDEIYAVIAPEITLFGVKGINVNQSDKDVLLSLFSRFDEESAKEVTDEILKRRDNPELGGPFKDEEDFSNFIGQYINSEDFNEERVPLFFGAELNFEISCTGISGNILREMKAIVYNGDEVEGRLKTALKMDNDDGTGAGGGSNLADQCKDLTGTDKYNCLCEDKADGAEKQNCIAQQQKIDRANQAQRPGGKKTKKDTSGPPKVISLEVD